MEDKEIETREGALRALGSVKKSSENDFEKNLIYITAGTLVLSLTFVEKVAPLPEAVHVWLIVTSWGLLSGSLILNLISHWVTIRSAVRFERTIMDDKISQVEINQQIDNENTKILKWNTATLGTMIFGIIFLVLYCSLNTLNMSKDDKKIPQVTEKRKVSDIIEKGRTFNRIPVFTSQNNQAQSDTTTNQNTNSDKK